LRELFSKSVHYTEPRKREENFSFFAAAQKGPYDYANYCLGAGKKELSAKTALISRLSFVCNLSPFRVYLAEAREFILYEVYMKRCDGRSFAYFISSTRETRAPFSGTRLLKYFMNGTDPCFTFVSQAEQVADEKNRPPSRLAIYAEHGKILI